MTLVLSLAGLGGLFSAGNSRTIAVTSYVKSRFRRDEHQFSAAGVANFARAGKKGETIRVDIGEEIVDADGVALLLVPGREHTLFHRRRELRHVEDLRHDRLGFPRKPLRLFRAA